VGAAQAHGSFLFFLNPDTEIEPGAIRTLRLFLSKNSQAAVTAPMLSDMHGQLYLDQGSTRLTPLTALASHSIVHRLWPNNPVAQEYWLRHRPVDQPQQVEVVPGTAFMIRTSIFKQIGGFDEQFFIYFEESDLCRRVVELGYECWLLPSAKVKHIWHAATQASHYKQIYKQSRYKYFKKYYGVVVAWLVELLLRVGKRELLIMSLAIIGVTIWLGILVTR
jgi:N-acetylglucosaminyl-diphospho-decaprenol L-rhamnosyltransferase